MTKNLVPTVGDWYQDVAGTSFEIVALDSAQGLIEMQFFDGTIEELDLESWGEQMYISIEQSEDWSGSLDIDKEDYGVDLEESAHFVWDDPLKSIDL